jgi:hypothetical protein
MTAARARCWRELDSNRARVAERGRKQAGDADDDRDEHRYQRYERHDEQRAKKKSDTKKQPGAEYSGPCVGRVMVARLDDALSIRWHSSSYRTID